MPNSSTKWHSIQFGRDNDTYGWQTQSMVERNAHVAPEGLQLAASRLDRFLLVKTGMHNDERPKYDVALEELI